MGRGLLGVLLTAPNRPFTVDALVDALWDGRHADNARQRLQLHIHQLRKALGEPDRIAREADSYLVRVDPDEFDVLRFEAHVSESRRAILAGRSQAAVAKLRAGLALWRGEAFEAAGDSLPVHQEADRLRALRLTALEELYTNELRSGRHSAVLPELLHTVTQHPLNERLHSLAMVALYRSGRRADALAAYQDVRDAMIEELGIEPGPELQRIQAQILAGRAVDLDESDDGPQLRTLPAQIPPDSASFTGRTEEIAAVESIVADTSEARPGTVRVVALDGMAGVGKTALAIHLGHRLAGHFPDGQLYVDLRGFAADAEPIRPADALDRMLRSLRVPGEQIPNDTSERSALLRTKLADKRMLVVLDNASSEEQVRPLLPAAPGCLILVTSRRRLSGLDDAELVSVDVLPADEAVELFRRTVGAARLANESDDAVHHVVALCGRLPLALRIAAARMRTRPTWKLADLAERLRDQRDRVVELTAGDRSVAAAFNLSYDQLSDRVQRVFRLLGLHPGSEFGVEAAAALTDERIGPARRLVDELVEMHLLETTSAERFHFHDLLAGYAAVVNRSVESDDDRYAAVRRLLDFYCDRVEAAVRVIAPGDVRPRSGAPADWYPFEGPGQATEWLRLEHRNLIAAAGIAVDFAFPEHVQAMSENLYEYLRHTRQLDDSLTLHGRALHAARQSHDRVAEGRALRLLGGVHHLMGDEQTANDLCEQALAVFKDADDRLGEYDALSLGATTKLFLGDLAGGWAQLQRALDLELDPDSIPASSRARLLHLLAFYCNKLGDHDAALRYARESIEVAATLAPWVRAEAWTGLAVALRILGRRDEAIEALRKSCDIYRNAHDLSGLSLALTQIGANLTELGRLDEALHTHDEALALARDAEDRNAQLESHCERGISLRQADRTGAAARELQLALELAGDLEQALDKARIHAELARTYRQGDDDLARKHWQLALDIYAECGAPEQQLIQGELAALL